MGIINFNQIGSINDGSPSFSPTSIQFGPDGRLYATEITGAINAFTVEKDVNTGDYVVTASEELQLPNGLGVVQSIRNHDDDGAINDTLSDRLVTGMIVTGTATNPILYISSADPRRSIGPDSNLDTNSGVITRLTWNGSDWDAVDIVRGLPRSEESHTVNGFELSADGSKLYVSVGGNTNNGAPSGTFAYTAEYALTAAILEIDLNDIDSRPILTDLQGGQNGTSRQYIYDLPTLDDPNVANDGVLEDVNGLDVAGPWGGNDGLNQAVLPADAPLRIFADGLRNNYDLVRTSNGLYTIDNGSNPNKGGNPVDSNGVTTGTPGAGEATNTIVEPGPGDDEPIFKVEDGGYYGHANPTRANQNQSWTVYDDTGNPDASLTVNTVADISALVPNAVNIQAGFLIDPSKFTADPTRLETSGTRVSRRFSGGNPDVNPLANLGLGFASTNGLIEYSGPAFDGALEGALIAVDLSGRVILARLSADGTSLDPFIDPGPDLLFNTADDEVLAADGIYQLLDGISTPIDITEGPDGTLWIASLFGGEIQVYEPSTTAVAPDPDFDDDGIDNISDPFIRDANNGRDVVLTPGQSLLWDFDENLDGNLPGPGGYAAGLTGVLVNGTTDFEETLDFGNVKFVTASGAGTIVVENVANGDALTSSNDAEYLFHTGLTIDSTVQNFTIKWSVINPAGDPGTTFTGASQQIGGYIGTGDQSSYLKIVAVQGGAGEIQILLEDNDVVQSSSFLQANDLFTNIGLEQDIVFELEIDQAANTATPTITYETLSGQSTVTGTAIDLTGTQVLDVLKGNYTAPGDTAPSGLAVGIFSTNSGQPEANSFPATFNGIEIIADELPPSLSIVDTTVDEDAGIATFTVALSTASDSVVTVDYATGAPGDTADAGIDYLSVAGSLTFAPGEKTKTFNVSIVDDNVEEASEVFAVGLLNAVGADVLDPDGVGTIVDNDGPPPPVAIHRINVGGGEVIAPNGAVWSADTNSSPSPHRVGNGGKKTFSYNVSAPVDLNDASLPEDALVADIFRTERWDPLALDNMKWDFDVSNGDYEVRLYLAELHNPVSFTGGRVFDVAVEGSVPVSFDDIDPFSIGGADAGFMVSHTVSVSDGTLNLEFFHGVDNPSLKGLEILALSPLALPELSINDVSVDEDAGTAVFTVSLSSATNTSVTVDYVTQDGTAFVGSDYELASGSLTFAAGETTHNITVNITDDLIAEGLETFDVGLSNVNGATLSDGTGTGTILANDASPNISIDDVTVGESGTATFSVTLSSVSVNSVTVDYSLGSAADSAVSGVDYVNGSGSVTFAPGETTQTIDVSILEDMLQEGDETFTVGLQNAVGGVVSDGSGTGTILDDDVPGVVLLETDGMTEVGEDGTSDSYSIVLLTQPSSDVTVTLSPDPQVSANTTQLVFTPGNWNTPQSVTVSGVDDLIVEGNQTVTISHSVSSVDPAYDSQTVSDLSVTVIDNDAPPAPTALHRINVGGGEVIAPNGAVWSADTKASPSPHRVGNGGKKTFSYNVNAPVDLNDASLPEDALVADIFRTERWDPLALDNMKWDFDVSNGDYEVRLYLAELHNPVSFTGGRVFDVAVEGSVPVSFDDIDPFSIGGADSGFMVSHTVSVSDGTLNLEFFHGVDNPSLKGLEILALSPLALPELSINDVSVDEDAGTAVFTVSLSSATNTSVTVDYVTQDGTAFVGSDYELASGSLTFAAGETTHNITVNITDDLIEEGLETFDVGLSNVNGATLSDGTGTGTILANDASPNISIDDVTVGESGTATFSVTLSSVSTNSVTVDYSLGSAADSAVSGVDYVNGSGSVTFAPGETTQTIDVSILEDMLQEGDETFTVGLQNAVGGVVSDGSGTGTILDDDVPGVVLLETDGMTEVGEDGTSDSYSIVLLTQPSSDVTVTLSPDPQVSANTTQLVFTPGNWNTPQSVTVSGVDDLIVEGNQTVTISHSISSVDPAYDSQTVSDLSVTVIDNDAPPAPTALHRINVGGGEVIASNGAVWSADTKASPSPHRVGNGGKKTFSYNASAPVDLNDASLPEDALVADIFRTERWDPLALDNMKWDFDVSNGDYEVRLYLAELHNPVSFTGGRVFDVAVEGSVPVSFDDIDPFSIGGADAGFMVSHTVSVSDGTLNLEFLHGVENPSLKGLEILAIPTSGI